MAADIGLFVATVLGIILFIFVVGITCYTFRNYCQRRFRVARRTSSGSPRRDEISYATTKTTTDEPDKSSMKLHTIDQILKQEEKGSVSQSLKQVELSQQQSQQQSPQQGTRI